MPEMQKLLIKIRKFWRRKLTLKINKISSFRCTISRVDESDCQPVSGVLEQSAKPCIPRKIFDNKIMNEKSTDLTFCENNSFIRSATNSISMDALSRAKWRMYKMWGSRELIILRVVLWCISRADLLQKFESSFRGASNGKLCLQSMVRN